MRGLAETLPQMLALLADVVRNPTFPQAEVDLIKANTAQQLQAQMASPQFVANKLFRQTLFGSHPYARIGVTPETLPAIDRASIVEYHKTYYRPNHAFLVVVGDVAPDAVFAAAEQAFGGWERRALPEDKPRRCRRSRAAGWSSCSGPTACSRPSRSATSRPSETTSAGTRCS